MPKFILCKIRSTPRRINGIDFEAHPEGIVSSEPVDDDVAEVLSSIPGYVALDTQFGTITPTPTTTSTPPASTDPTSGDGEQDPSGDSGAPSASTGSDVKTETQAKPTIRKGRGRAATKKENG